MIRSDNRIARTVLPVHIGVRSNARQPFGKPEPPQQCDYSWPAAVLPPPHGATIDAPNLRPVSTPCDNVEWLSGAPLYDHASEGNR
jgi:hypothetical protein